MRKIHSAECISVFAGLGDFREANHSAGARLVDKYPGLLDVLVPVLLHDAGLYVTGPTGRKGNDQINRFFRIGSPDRTADGKGESDGHGK